MHRCLGGLDAAWCDACAGSIGIMGDYGKIEKIHYQLMQRHIEVEQPVVTAVNKSLKLGRNILKERRFAVS